MSWLRVNAEQAHGDERDNITIAIRADNRRGLKRQRVFAALRIGPAIAAEFTWKLHDKIEVAWGADEHAGMMRLEKVAGDGYSLRRKGKSANESFTLEVKAPRWIVAATQAAKCRAVTRDGAAMVLPLPAYFLEQYLAQQSGAGKGEEAPVRQPEPAPEPAQSDTGIPVTEQNPAADVSDLLEKHDRIITADELVDAAARFCERFDRKAWIDLRHSHGATDKQADALDQPARLAMLLDIEARLAQPEIPSAQHGQSAQAGHATMATPVTDNRAEAGRGEVSDASRGSETRPAVFPLAAPWMRAGETFPKLLDAIAKAAAANDPAPTGLDVMDLCGLKSDGAASFFVQAMERSGLITVERLAHPFVRRVITIVATGARTFDPRIDPPKPVTGYVSREVQQAIAEFPGSLAALRAISMRHGAKAPIDVLPENQAAYATAIKAETEALRRLGVRLGKRQQSTINKRGPGPGDRTHKTPGKLESVLGLIVSHARDGKVAPTNGEICKLVDLKSEPEASFAIGALMKAEKITVAHVGRCRIITITETGARTLDPRIKPSTDYEGGNHVAPRAIDTVSPTAPAGRGPESAPSESTGAAQVFRTKSPASSPPSESAEARPVQMPPSGACGGGLGVKAKASGSAPLPIRLPNWRQAELDQINAHMESKGATRVSGHVQTVADVEQAVAALEAKGKKPRKVMGGVIVDGRRIVWSEFVAWTNSFLRSGMTVRVKPGDPIPFTMPEAAAGYCREILNEIVIRRPNGGWRLNGSVDLTDAQVVDRANRALTGKDMVAAQ